MKGVMARRRAIDSFSSDWDEEKKNRAHERLTGAMLMASTLLLSGFVLYFILKAFSNYTITP